jgi:hypothetical protein
MSVAVVCVDRGWGCVAHWWRRHPRGRGGRRRGWIMRPNESCNTVTSVLGSEISVWMGEVLSVGGVLNDGGGMSVVRGAYSAVVVVLRESGWLFSVSVLVL